MNNFVNKYVRFLNKIKFISLILWYEKSDPVIISEFLPCIRKCNDYLTLKSRYQVSANNVFIQDSLLEIWIINKVLLSLKLHTIVFVYFLSVC